MRRDIATRVPAPIILAGHAMYLSWRTRQIEAHMRVARARTEVVQRDLPF